MGQNVGKAFKKGALVAGGAIAGMVTASINQVADLEQSVGGIETLFKESAPQVIENANKAYKTAGLDANKYMEQVTSYSASLLQSLGGDTEKAGKVADMAIIDMADNANKMGTSMEMIQNAYQGFAKQNYTMLDNLKLGYGGTKTEMERLLADASKISGIEYDISNLSDVYNAIHVIQGELGITGTTAKEATQTISGSIASAKSAFKNFLSGAGGIEEVIETFMTVGSNIAKAVIKMAPQIFEGLITLISTLLPELITLLAENLPTLIDALIKGFILIVNTLAEQAPVLIPQIVDAILGIIPVLIDNLPLFISAGWQLIKGLAIGLIKAVPSLISNMFDIGKNLIKGLWNGIKNVKDWILNKIKGFGKAVIDKIKGIFGVHSPSKVMFEIGGYLDKGFINGISDMQKDVNKQMNTTFGSGLNYLQSGASSYSAGHSNTALMNMASNQSLGFDAEETNSLLVDLNKNVIGLTNKQTILEVNGKQLAQATYQNFEEEGNRLGKSSVVVRR